MTHIDILKKLIDVETNDNNRRILKDSLMYMENLKSTLENAGWTYKEGATAWKPPLGKSLTIDTMEIARLKDERLKIFDLVQFCRREIAIGNCDEEILMGLLNDAFSLCYPSEEQQKNRGTKSYHEELTLLKKDLEKANKRIKKYAECICFDPSSNQINKDKITHLEQQLKTGREEFKTIHWHAADKDFDLKAIRDICDNFLKSTTDPEVK